MVSELEEFLARANRFVSPRTGLITQITELCRETEDPRIHLTAAQKATTSRYGLPVDMPSRNGGAGLSLEVARAAALGEAIERYSCSIYFPDELLLASYRELPGRGVHPDMLNPYSDSQYARPRFPFRQLSEDSPLRWRQAVTMGDAEPIWYPAGLTHIPYRWGNDETIFAPGVSTGMALGLNQIDAALSGLCEVIERDAIMIMWWNRLPAPEIEVPDDSALGRLIARNFHVPGLRFRLFNITSDIGIPSVFCTVEELTDRQPGCAIAVGAATRPDPEQAARKALVEAVQTRQFGRYLSRRDGPISLEEEFHNVRSLDDHVRVYARPDMRHVFNFLHQNGGRVRLSDLPNVEAVDRRTTLRRCVDIVRARGLEPIAMDLTPPDVADVGLAAVKVAVPAMVDLNPWHALRCQGNRRLYDVPVHLGYRDEPLREEELSPFPHPFP